MNTLLQSISEQRVAAFMLVLGRVGPLFVLAPLFSSRSFAPQVRTIAAVALAVGLSPIALGTDQVPLEIATFVGLMLKEILVGLAFAFAVGALFQAVAVAGSLMDTTAGFGFGALVDPLTGAQAAVLSQLYAMVAVMVFVAIGGDAWVIQGLAHTYHTVPLTAAPDLAHMVGGIVDAFSGVFVAAVEVAAPVLLALVVTDAGFGIVSRVVPQMNVFAVGFPAKILVALLIVGASLPFMGGYVAGAIPHAIQQAMGVIR